MALARRIPLHMQTIAIATHSIDLGGLVATNAAVLSDLLLFAILHKQTANDKLQQFNVLFFFFFLIFLLQSDLPAPIQRITLFLEHQSNGGANTNVANIGHHRRRRLRQPEERCSANIPENHIQPILLEWTESAHGIHVAIGESSYLHSTRSASLIRAEIFRNFFVLNLPQFRLHA